MRDWITIDRENGQKVQGSKGHMIDIPVGPYALVSQHDMEAFENDPNSVRFEKTSHFVLELGKATYAVGMDMNPLKIGYWYDTSD